MRPFLIPLLLALFGTGVLGSASAAQKPLRVLLVLVGGGPHDIEKNPPFLEKAALGTGVQITRLAPEAGRPQSDTAHLAKLAALKPGDYDVVAFYTVAPALGPEQEAALQKFVEQGGGIVAIHGASASFGKSQTWLNLVGARFAGHASGTFTLPITVTDSKHPITRGVKDFEIVDEEYTHRFADGVSRHVLAAFKQRPPQTAEKNGNNDVLWTVEVGKGRVVYNALGHGEDAWKNPSWQKLILQSFFWSAGHPREVKITQ